ncbi:carbohydrate ABC transporter permease [Olsenella sp. Marseille-QA0557]|uniref:Carbohydrate ABC transporter permease n=1 Tax=Candidatus Coprovicinus avistercoris TaxID=2840754 RepID=A0A9D1HZ70_9ACTN|nr:carbohydrate ABC transporter permease [Candidatus Coprovicinus avistercoris]
MAKDAYGAKVKERVNWPITIALILLAIVVIVFPLYMTARISVSETMPTGLEIFTLPAHWDFANFLEAIKETQFFSSFLNSLLITVVAVVVSILLHSLAAYAIGRNMDRKPFKWSYLFIIAGMYVPFAILMMPLVKQTAILHLDNMLGVMILYIVFYMPMNIMLYTGYLRNIPIALEEAARVDGASTWTTFWKIIFPIMKPMHATVAVITGLAVWNDVMTPLVIMGGSGVYTLPLAQMSFQTAFGTDYPLAFASYLLAMLPMIIFYIFAQKQIIGGVTNGAVK